MLKPRLSLVLALAAVSCSSAPSAQNGQSTPPEYAIAQSGGDVIQTTVDGSRIYGPSIMIERTAEGLRGNGPFGVVDLRREGNALRGIIGTQPTELYVEPLENGAFVLRGMFSGSLGRLEVRSDRVEGQLGRCQFNLRPQEAEKGVAYNGRRVCGTNASFRPITVTLAPSIVEMEPIDRAAVLAILLGR
jgi:hypothetical protein